MFNVMVSLNMFILFMIFSFMSMLFYYLDLAIILEWLIFSFNSVNIKVMLLFDWVSLLFMSFILLISSMIMLYSMEYMSGERNMMRFNYLLILFIMSMILMVISPNIISILLGWDGLGLVSYCLIVYYNNYLSYSSGMVTVLCNRMGDVGILMSVSLMMVKGGWDFAMFSKDIMLLLMLMLAALTKSAQIPFSVWLPLAMAAPTPVSALVHSSTLVTAGVYLMIRFNKILSGGSVSLCLCFISVITMFMAGLVANFENDFKKVIALSTLSQLGLMMMILSRGWEMLAFYHLLVHAVFKSMLFMAAGVVIHLMKNNQDIRLLGSLNEVLPYTMMSLLVSNMSLGGFPFMAGFYSKDLIMEMVYVDSMISMFMFVMIIISLMFTISYSIRFMYYLFFNSSVKFCSHIYIKEGGLVNVSMFMMMLLSICVGSMMNWFFFFDYCVIYMSILMKLMTLSFSLLGGILGGIMMLVMNKFMNLCCLLSCLRHLYYIVSMWYLIQFYGLVYTPVILVSLKLFEVDKVWFEFMEEYFLISFLYKKFINISYKLYMFMFIFINMSIYLYLWY